MRAHPARVTDVVRARVAVARAADADRAGRVTGPARVAGVESAIVAIVPAVNAGRAGRMVTGVGAVAAIVGADVSVRRADGACRGPETRDSAAFAVALAILAGIDHAVTAQAPASDEAPAVGRSDALEGTRDGVAGRGR